MQKTCDCTDLEHWNIRIFVVGTLKDKNRKVLMNIVFKPAHTIEHVKVNDDRPSAVY